MAEPEPSQPTQSPEPPPRKGLIEAILRSVSGRQLGPLVEYLGVDEEIVRKLPGIMFAVCLFGAMCGYLLKGCMDDGAIRAQVGANATNSATISSLNSQLQLCQTDKQSKDSTIQLITTEKGNLQTRLTQ